MHRCLFREGHPGIADKNRKVRRAPLAPYTGTASAQGDSAAAKKERGHRHQHRNMSTGSENVKSPKHGGDVSSEFSGGQDYKEHSLPIVL